MLQLVRGLDRNRFCVSVGATHGGGARRQEFLEVLGEALVSFGGEKGSLISVAKNAKHWGHTWMPDIIYSFEEGPNLLGLIVARQQKCPLVWGIRNAPSQSSGLDTWKGEAKKLLNRVLCHYPAKIVYNSRRGEEIYQQRGFPADRGIVIGNGFSESAYFPDAVARAEIRKQWGFSDDDILVGLVATVKPPKNHPLFIQAVKNLAESHPKVKFICIGPNFPDRPILGEYLRECQAQSADLIDAGRFFWFDDASNMRAVYNGLDMVVLSSLFEGTPNVLAEACMCGTLCVSTDAGDAGRIVNNPDLISGLNIDAFTSCLDRALCLPLAQRNAIAESLRQNVLNNYSMTSMVERTSLLLEEVCLAR